MTSDKRIQVPFDCNEFVASLPFVGPVTYRMELKASILKQNYTPTVEHEAWTLFSKNFFYYFLQPVDGNKNNINYKSFQQRHSNFFPNWNLLSQIYLRSNSDLLSTQAQVSQLNGKNR